MKEKRMTLSFRATDAEVSAIRTKADRRGISVSSYIRESTLQHKEVFLPKSLYDKLDALDELNRRIGTNVNQIARAVNRRGFLPKDEYMCLTGYLQEIERAYNALVSAIQGTRTDGDIKADAIEGDCWKSVDTSDP